MLLIVSTQHIHLDHDNCLEIVAVRGTPAEIDAIAKRLKAVKGLKHISLADQFAVGQGFLHGDRPRHEMHRSGIFQATRQTWPKKFPSGKLSVDFP